MFRRSFSLLVAIAVFTGLFGAAPAGACAGGPSLESFEVITKWSKKSYAPGATASVEVTVLRPAPRDPLGLGVDLEPPTQTPVEGAYVISALAVGVPPLWGVGETGPDGTVRIDIKLRKDLRGPIYATTRASIIYNENGPDCTNVEEWGRMIDNPAFVVKKG